MSGLSFRIRIALALLLALAPPAGAQQDQGVITGRVTDASGAVLPAVSVTATAIATGVTAHAITDSDGLYTIPALTVGSYRVGVDLARNQLEGPGYVNLDAGLMKNVRIGERKRLQVRCEVFNLLNHPSFGQPNTNLLSQDFGTIRSTVSTPRQMQFGVKFIF